MCARWFAFGNDEKQKRSLNVITNAGWMDSFLMATGMAISGCPLTFRRQVIAGFIAFDFLASFAGLSLNVPGAVAVVLAFALAFALIRAGMTRPVFYLLVPVLGCVDNLFVAGSNTFQLWPALSEGVASGIAAWAGFTLGCAILAPDKRTKGGLA
jgi:hypothetical protein